MSFYEKLEAFRIQGCGFFWRLRISGFFPGLRVEDSVYVAVEVLG